MQVVLKMPLKRPDRKRGGTVSLAVGCWKSTSQSIYGVNAYTNMN